jgi:hypothetical protein
MLIILAMLMIMVSNLNIIQILRAVFLERVVREISHFTVNYREKVFSHYSMIGGN